MYFYTKEQSRLVNNNFFPLWSTIYVSTLVLALHFFFKSGFALSLMVLLSALFFLLYGWSFSYSMEELGGEDGVFLSDSLYLVMAFFILGEAFLFFSFFWAWFNHKWAPLSETSFLILPLLLKSINWKSIPVMNTLLLLSSAVSITVVHHKYLSSSKGSFKFFLSTLLLASLFLFLQGLEYHASATSMSDSVYGSMFFTLTGFHGFHVLVGVCFLSFSYLLVSLNLLSSIKHLFFELSVYYYHFVDVVWLGLFLVVYCKISLSTLSLLNLKMTLAPLIFQMSVLS